MTVIAGASLFGGVVLAADTRSTYVYPDGREIFVDHLQTILPIAPHVCLGYSGNVVVAGPDAEETMVIHWIQPYDSCPACGYDLNAHARDEALEKARREDGRKDLAPGTYDLAVFAYSTVRNGFAPAKTVRVQVR